MRILKKLLSYGGNHKYFTIISLILSGISSVVLLFPFFYIWKIVDYLFKIYPDFSNIESVEIYAWKALIFSIIGIFLYVISLLCSHLAAFRIASNMRINTMKHVLKFPLGYLDDAGTGKVRKIIDEASSVSENFLAHHLPDLVQMVVTIIVMLIFIFSFNWIFGIASLMPIIIAFYYMWRMLGKDLEIAMVNYNNALESMSNEATEYIRGIPVVKTFQQTVFSFNKFNKSILNYKDFSMQYSKSQSHPMTMYNSFINSIFGFLIIACILLLINGYEVEYFFSDFLFYIMVTPILTVMASKVISSSEDLMMTKDAIRRIDSIMNINILEEKNEVNSLESYKIEFKNVSFSYPNSTELVLKNINLSIEEGSTVAFIGPSGGGKSTLVSLIPKFFNIDKGSILIGGINIENICEKLLMEKVSFVFQNGKLLEKTIYENVNMGSNKSREEVLQVLEDAQCTAIVEKLEDGIDTLIGTEGTYLSGGEVQRITIARAFLKNSPILLLDEASAFVDPDNEEKIQEAISKLSEGKTTLMIAHRLTSIKNVDRIFVLDDGEIKESGNHKELIEKNGLYRKLWDEYTKSINWNIKGESQND